MFGTIAIGYGFGIYYFLPLSLVSFNFSLATSIFLFILFGMIFALTVLVINFMPYINVGVARVFLFFEKSSVKIMVLKNLIAHRERNRMTSIMFSLTLGFIIFLSIVCQIPFAKGKQDAEKASGTHTINIGRFNLPMTEIDTVLRRYEYAFEDFGAFTSSLFNKDNNVFYEQRKDMTYENYIDTVDLTDVSRRTKFRVGIVGVSPSMPDAVEEEYLKISASNPLINQGQSWWNDQGGLSIGEYLYSSEGY
jgi:hypothetical protein